MIKRTFPELMAAEIVGVQPMTGPVGTVFKLNYKYDQTEMEFEYDPANEEGIDMSKVGDFEFE